MDCKEIREILAAWALGDLPEARTGEVERHLGSCPECRKEADSLRRVLEGVRTLPPPPADPARRAALFRTAEAEGLLPAPSRVLRWALPAAALAAAAAVLLLVAGPGLFSPPAPPPGPRGDGGRVLGEQPPDPPQKPLAWFVEGRGASLLRAGKTEPRPLQKKDALFPGDRVMVASGEDNKALLRFYIDALDLDVLPSAGDAEIQIEGSSEEAYEIRVDRGKISGRFTQPIEILSSRTKGGSFIPLVITSPVGRAEMRQGRNFHVTQEKTTFPADWFETQNAQDTVSLHYHDADLLQLAGGPFARVLPGLQFDPALLRGKRISLLCRSVPRARFADALDAALRPLGLKATSAGGKTSILPLEGGMAASAAGGDDPAYGEFLVEIASPKGEMRISSRNPKHPEVLVLPGEGKAVVRPGAEAAFPSLVPAIETTALEGGLELLGTMAAGGDVSLAFVRLDEKGSPVLRSVRPGDEVAGTRCVRIGWDHLILARDDKEIRLEMK
jgi:hypothetical protein